MQAANKKRKNVLLIVQNNSFPFDKRVYKEGLSLKNAGFRVSVISPMSKIDSEKRISVDGIEIYRYKYSPSSGGILSFFKEFAFSVLKINLLFFILHLKKNFAVVHVANPPDFFWPLALICKITGSEFIYDQHDLSPEIYKNKYDSKGLLYRALVLNERLTVALADAVIVVNNSFKKRLEKKYGHRDKYVIVYNSPSNDFEPKRNDSLIKRYTGKKIVLYIGLMTKNDNIENILEAARKIIIDKKRNDVRFILLGSGDVEEMMKAGAEKNGLRDFIEFKGFVEQNTVMEYLYIADVGIAPDMPNGLNEYLTLVKVLEYMKAGKAFAGFKLKEMMEMAQDSGLYASDINEFSLNILELINNPEKSKNLGIKGMALVREKYLWSYSEKILLNVYSNLIGN